MQETILILDFGSQYTQLIARRVRELNVYCEIHPFNHFPAITPHIRGVILSGSPASVRDKEAPFPDLSGIRPRIPVLGVCYGAQYLAQADGGEVMPSKIREYGRANLSFIAPDSELFRGMTVGSQVWMSHADTILQTPATFVTEASTADVKVAGFRIGKENTYGIQFHPEVYHSTEGMVLLKNFVVNICGCHQEWTPESFVEATVAKIRKLVGTDKVVLGLSGGVDSSVTGILMQKAIGDHLYCIFVDNGVLRKNEFGSVLDSYRHMRLNVKGVDASARFLDGLKGVEDPEKKRKIIGKTFIDVFEEEAKKIEGIKWLAQGTIYPDVIESVSVKGPSATIKSHHNVGGLPEHLNLKIIEPLNSLFKDEVRRVGRTVGLDPDLLGRHPFPGPGLAVRILGEVNRPNVGVLQEVDDIFIRALKAHDLYDKVWQAFAVLLPVRSVGVMGDERTYENVVSLRAVTSTDGMTADWAHLPHEFLAKVSNEIINKVKGVNRVVYDISSKPPATIEWE
ncbi:MAG TPA: glutamine-hydrolyzing GMP synthase [Bacteroidales bacterium]|nr:glutamine-hydrolyzing GMP synthase [Bacteroidales bacterium]